MLVRLYTVIDREDDELEREVKEELLKLCPELSFSPSRPQPSLAHCLEFYATAEITKEQAQSLLEVLNNDWTKDEDVWESYGFNTVMFHPNVYFLQAELRNA